MGGSLLSGMSTRVVTPPAAAAEVAAVIPAQREVARASPVQVSLATFMHHGSRPFLIWFHVYIPPCIHGR